MKVPFNRVRLYAVLGGGSEQTTSKRKPKMLRYFAYTAVWAVAWMAATVWAADLDMVLKAPQSKVHGGDTVLIELYLHNPADAPITRELPLTLPCRIDLEQTNVSTQADLIGKGAMSRVAIPAGGFAKRQYTVTIPVYAMGSVRIQLEEIGVDPITIMVAKAPPKAWLGQQVPLDHDETLAQSFLDDFSVHKPMYFLLGVDPGLEQSKFQFSFKYRLFNPEGYLAEKAPWVTGFHMAYTQRSIWDLADDSKPFDDTSYMPELFYQIPKIDLHVERISAFGIQAGFEHESNGKGGDASRSTNRLYVRPIMAVYLVDSLYLMIAPQVFTYVNNSESSNDDLMDYRGYFDLEVGIGDTEGLELKSHLGWAKEGATVQMDLTYPMTRLSSKSLNFYLHAQYFNGYAETLLHYKERQNAFRLGFSIVR